MPKKTETSTTVKRWKLFKYNHGWKPLHAHKMFITKKEAREWYGGNRFDRGIYHCNIKVVPVTVTTTVTAEWETPGGGK